MSSKRVTNTYIIASGKGGVGKTWFSINLAHALGIQSKRVLLFDGDLGLANVDIQLDLNPQWDIGCVLKRKCTFEQAILNYKPHKNFKANVDIIAGRTNEDGFTTVSKAGVISLRNSITNIAPKYDHLLLDLSAGLDQIIQEFSTFAQHCLVVVTDEPTSLADAFAYVKVSNQRNPDLPLYVVVNKAESNIHGLETYTKLVQACKHFLKTTPTLIGVIHRDRCVPESIQKKTPILASHPTSQVAQDIERIATELIGLSQ